MQIQITYLFYKLTKESHCVKSVRIRKVSVFFWPVFPRIWTEYGEIRNISPYSVQMQENTDQKNSGYEHFLRSE